MSAPDAEKTQICRDLSIARKPLARLRCLKECLDNLKDNKPLPRSLCYIAAEVEYIPVKNANVAVYSQPSKSSKKLADVMCTTEHRVFISGEELFTTDGQWAKLIKVSICFSGHIPVLFVVFLMASQSMQNADLCQTFYYIRK
jgi:hypothetical protein